MGVIDTVSGVAGYPPIVEDGAMIIDDVPVKSQGDVITGKDNYFQSFVSVKRGFKEDSHTFLGHNNYVASFCNIGHNVNLGNNNYLAPNVILGGYVTLGEHVYLGMGVKVVQNITIGNWVKVAAGNVITKNIPSNTYVDLKGNYRRNEVAKVLSGQGRTS